MVYSFDYLELCGGGILKLIHVYGFVFVAIVDYTYDLLFCSISFAPNLLKFDYVI